MKTLVLLLMCFVGGDLKEFLEKAMANEGYTYVFFSQSNYGRYYSVFEEIYVRRWHNTCDALTITRDETGKCVAIRFHGQHDPFGGKMKYFSRQLLIEDYSVEELQRYIDQYLRLYNFTDTLHIRLSDVLKPQKLGQKYQYHSKTVQNDKRVFSPEDNERLMNAERERGRRNFEWNYHRLDKQQNSTNN